MAYGAAVGASRPAAIALVVIGLAAFGIALLVDRPDIHKTGIVGTQFSNAEAKPGIGYWLEYVGAGLVLVAGVLRLLRPGPRA